MNTAILRVVESLLLRPLPYKDASGLVQLRNAYPPMLPQDDRNHPGLVWIFSAVHHLPVVPRQEEPSGG